jgi:hypothetical protein
MWTSTSNVIQSNEVQKEKIQLDLDFPKSITTSIWKEVMEYPRKFLLFLFYLTSSSLLPLHSMEYLAIGGLEPPPPHPHVDSSLLTTIEHYWQCSEIAKGASRQHISHFFRGKQNIT